MTIINILMVIFSYQGIYDGQNFEIANTPNQLGSALNHGFSCMTNVWRLSNKLYVGTINAPIEVTEKYLQGSRFIINAMNTDMYNWLLTQPAKLYPNFFQFPTPSENTNVTTSAGQIITPGSVPLNNSSIVYLPEITDRGLFSTVKYRCYGVISNYCTFIRRMRNEGTFY